MPTQKQLGNMHALSPSGFRDLGIVSCKYPVGFDHVLIFTEYLSNLPAESCSEYSRTREYSLPFQ